ncbi:MAG: hypothetical protein LBE24_08805 [Methylobacillus sp.]|nr:hypothetical protein [Methylobacillus sp.]
MKSSFFLFLFFPLTAFADSSLAIVEQVLKNELASKYELADYLQPQILQVDLDGDGEQDIAALIQEADTEKSAKGGLLIIHAKTKKTFILAAGTRFAQFDDFKLDGEYEKPLKWSSYIRSTAPETQFGENGDILGKKYIKLSHPGITMEFGNENISIPGVIYWDGTKYIWIHGGP